MDSADAGDHNVQAGRFLFFFKDFDTRWLVVQVFQPDGSRTGEVVEVSGYCENKEEAEVWASLRGAQTNNPVYVAPKTETLNHEQR